jgi:hypothetical protein
MEVCYFSTEHDLEEDKLLRVIKAVLPGKQIVTFSDIKKLKDTLKLHIGSGTVAILVALTEEALLDIYCIHYVFHSISTILILPDNDKCFQALAYRMKPNFLFYADSKEEDIVSVIAEITGKTRKMSTINERRIHDGIGNLGKALPRYLEDKVSNL